MLIALLFNECINVGDLDGLCALMTRDHVFIDMEHDEVRGRDNLRDSWSRFFRNHADYRNRFLLMKFTGANVSVMGYSTCSAEELDGPALWGIGIEDDRVAEWRVWMDTPGNRKLLGIN